MKAAPLVLLTLAVLCIGTVGMFFVYGVESPDEQVPAETKVDTESSATSTQELVSTESEQTEETKSQKPYFKVVFKANADTASVFSQNADVFVSNGNMTVGKDSRTGKIEEWHWAEHIVAGNGDIEIELTTFDAHANNVIVAVVGLQNGEYELSGVLKDEAGDVHEFSFASTTKEKVMDEYSFKLATGASGVKRTDYGNEVITWPQFEDDAGVCDDSGLKQQLTRILTDAGWDMNAVPLVSEEVGFVDSLELQRLPFGTEKVCAIAMNFRRERSGSGEVAGSSPKLVWALGHSSQLITVGGKQFGENPGDGPLGTANVLPFTQTGNEIQFLAVSEHTSLIPVHFPVFSVCPCSRNYQAVLTAPMYP